MERFRQNIQKTVSRLTVVYIHQTRTIAIQSSYPNKASVYSIANITRRYERLTDEVSQSILFHTGLLTLTSLSTFVNSRFLIRIEYIVNTVAYGVSDQPSPKV